MSGYYNKPSSPRQSLANLKHISEKRGDYNEITGQQSKNNPFAEGANGKYDAHISSHYKQNQYNKPYGNMAV